MKLDRETDVLNCSLAESKVMYSNYPMKAAPRNCSIWISCNQLCVRDFISTKQKIFVNTYLLNNYFNSSKDI